MTDYSQAASELDWFAAKLKATFAVTDELRRVGSLAQAANAAEVRLQELKRQHDAERDAHNIAIKDAIAKREAIAKEIDSVQMRLSSAQQDMAMTQAQLEQDRAAHAIAIAAHRDQLQVVQQQAEAARNRLATLEHEHQTRMTAMAAEIDEWKSRITALQADWKNLQDKHTALMEVHEALKTKVLRSLSG
jgi:chromosome segregation ATPase